MESLKKVYKKITSDPPLYFLGTIAVINLIITLSVYAQDEFRNINLAWLFTIFYILFPFAYLGKVKQHAIVGLSSIFNICFAIYLWVESLDLERSDWVAAAVIYTFICVVFYGWFIYDTFAHLRSLEDFEKGFTDLNVPKRDLRFRIEI